MMKISFDSILLFSLIVPFIMTYRIGPGDTPYWLFGGIFFGMLAYIILDFMVLKEKAYALYKMITLWIIIISVIGSAFISAIIVRHQTSPLYMIHDITLQQEIAIRSLLDGKNPYAITYFGTILEQWNYSDTDVNPAIYHFVMMPLYLLLSLPFYIVSVTLFGFFDGRIPLLLFFIAFIIFVSFLTINNDKKRLLMVLFVFHPAILPYTLEGRSDMFMFPFLFAALFFLRKNKYLISGLFMGCAFAIKQSAWFIFPFYLAYLFFVKKRFKAVLNSSLSFLLVFVSSVFPFLIWDPKAFMDSTIFYLSGNTPNSYPIAGYGFGRLLHQLGFIGNLHDYYPFFIWQLFICIPVLIVLLKYLKRSPTVGRLTLCYGIFLFIVWYFSRYFNNNHIAYISFVFVAAYAFLSEELSVLSGKQRAN